MASGQHVSRSTHVNKYLKPSEYQRANYVNLYVVEPLCGLSKFTEDRSIMMWDIGVLTTFTWSTPICDIYIHTVPYEAGIRFDHVHINIGDPLPTQHWWPRRKNTQLTFGQSNSTLVTPTLDSYSINISDPPLDSYSSSINIGSHPFPTQHWWPRRSICTAASINIGVTNVDAG